jgi:hypothetical protein
MFQIIRRTEPASEVCQRSMLKAELMQVRVLLDENDMRFNMTSDPNLTDCAVYERVALLARYRYLLGEIRKIDRQDTAVITQEARDAATI